MKTFTQVDEMYRAWLRETLQQTLGNTAENTDFISLPVKNLMQISIEEVYLYLMRKQWPSPQKTTAEILEIGKVSVWRAIKKLSN